MYDYKEAMKKDVLNWIEENGEFDYDVIYDSCWVNDSVTGNASGSYTFNRLQARDYIIEGDGEDYFVDMVQEGFLSYEEIGKRICSGDWEYLDVSIRCYLLGEVISEALEDIDNV